jgi:hypothetical protein
MVKSGSFYASFFWKTLYASFGRDRSDFLLFYKIKSYRVLLRCF